MDETDAYWRAVAELQSQAMRKHYADHEPREAVDAWYKTSIDELRRYHGLASHEDSRPAVMVRGKPHRG